MATKNILVELCLTVPARLASLLPHLPLMMRLMVHALRCRGDLDGLALRTLEFWVDNLNPDYLYRVLSNDTKVKRGGGRRGRGEGGFFLWTPRAVARDHHGVVESRRRLFVVRREGVLGLGGTQVTRKIVGFSFPVWCEGGPPELRW